MKTIQLDSFADSMRLFNSLQLDSEMKKHSVDVAKIAWKNLRKPNVLSGKDLLIVSVALFHDLYEDTDYRFSENVDREFLSAVKLLTREKDVSYNEYIQKIKDSGNEIAKFVKLCDIEDHLTKKTTLKPSLKERYLKAKKLLES